MKNDKEKKRDQDERNKDIAILDYSYRFNQTLKSVRGLLIGRSMPGKILSSRWSDSNSKESLPNYKRNFSHNDAGTSGAVEEEVQSIRKPNIIVNVNKFTISTSHVELSEEVRKSTMSARATDSARVMKFTKVLSGTMVNLDKLRELTWSGVPDYMRPTVWRLLLGYAPPSSDRRDRVLRRKRLEYLDCISQYYDIPDTERSDDEVNMLRQIAVDCPRTVPDVSFFQQQQVQKSLERILYAWLDIIVTHLWARYYSQPSVLCYG